MHSAARRMLIGVILSLALLAQPANAGTGGPAEPAGADTVIWYELTPVVVDPEVVQNVALVVQTSGGPIDGVQVRLANGSTVSLNNNGGGLFSTVLTHAQVLFGYAADDYNHNFIGYMDLLDGADVLGTYNSFINVADERVAAAPLFSLAGDMQATSHVVNIRVPAMNAASPNVISATTRFYDIFPDDYDFLNVIFVPERPANRTHTVIFNLTAGIGLGYVNFTASYGSGGNLLGLNQYPITSLFDLAETASVHEFGHQWINYLDLPELASGGAHWPLSSLARGIMGFSGDGGQGLNFPYDLVPLGGGDYGLLSTSRPPVFNDLELYLMGMLAPGEVGEHFVFDNQNQVPCHACILNGPVTTFTMEDVIDLHGPRAPNYLTAQHQFRVATIVATRNRLLNAREMAFFTYMAKRASLTMPVPYSAGLAKGITYPFYAATRGVGCLTSRLVYTPDDGCYAVYLPVVEQ